MSHIILNDKDASLAIRDASIRIGGRGGPDYKGCLPRITPYGLCPGTLKSKDIFPRIPRHLWPQMIREGNGTFLQDLTKDTLPVHDQNGFSLCWMHGSVRALELVKIYEGQTPELLSAECAAFMVTGGRDRGGFPEEALDQLRTKGTCSENLWPRNSLNDKSAKDGWQSELPYNVILDWMDVENWDDQMTLALNRIPVPIGLGWWGHLVCQLGPALGPNDEPVIVFDNSWGQDWGDNGRGMLNEAKGTADLGAFAPISATFQKRLERFLEIGCVTRP
jgi:hypothetical protein